MSEVRKEYGILNQGALTPPYVVRFEGNVMFRDVTKLMISDNKLDWELFANGVQYVDGTEVWLGEVLRLGGRFSVNSCIG